MLQLEHNALVGRGIRFIVINPSVVPECETKHHCNVSCNGDHSPMGLVINCLYNEEHQ